MGKVWDVLAPRNLELGPLAGSARGQGNWRNWKLARDDDGVLLGVLDAIEPPAHFIAINTAVAYHVKQVSHHAQVPSFP